MELVATILKFLKVYYCQQMSTCSYVPAFRKGKTNYTAVYAPNVLICKHKTDSPGPPRTTLLGVNGLNSRGYGYGGDTQSRNLYKLTCTRNLTVWHGFLYKIFLVQVSCTEYSTALFHTRNWNARDLNGEL